MIRNCLWIFFYIYKKLWCSPAVSVFASGLPDPGSNLCPEALHYAVYKCGRSALYCCTNNFVLNLGGLYTNKTKNFFCYSLVYQKDKNWLTKLFLVLKVSIPFNSTNNLAPTPYFRVDVVSVAVNMVLNCPPLLTTKYTMLSSYHLTIMYTFFIIVF